MRGGWGCLSINNELHTVFVQGDAKEESKKSKQKEVASLLNAILNVNVIKSKA